MAGGSSLCSPSFLHIAVCARLAHEQKWREKYDIFIGSGPEYKGSYSEHLARSKFCLAVPGDGYSARYADAVLHGCIPVVVMDNVEEAFESVLDYKQFSIRINESDIERTPDILRSIPDTLVLQMQRSLAKVFNQTYNAYKSSLSDSPFHHVMTDGMVEIVD